MGGVVEGRGAMPVSSSPPPSWKPPPLAGEESPPVPAFLAAILVPWIEAYRSNQSMTYLYSDINGRNIDCMVVDGCFFDRYYCLLFDESAIGQVRENNGKIVLNGKPMQFPRGTNVGFLQSDGKIQFAWLNPNDITPIHAGRSEIYYIFGKIPSFKHFPSGVPRVDLVLQRTQNWK